MFKHKKPYVGYFEVSVDNLERAEKFYSELFGWKIEKDDKKVTNRSYGEYYMISNPEEPIGPEGHPHYLGGMIKRQHPKQSITIYVDVNEIDSYLKRLLELGGTILQHKSAVIGYGYFAVCQDTESNIFALWEENKEAQ